MRVYVVFAYVIRACDSAMNVAVMVKKSQRCLEC